MIDVSLERLVTLLKQAKDSVDLDIKSYMTAKRSQLACYLAHVLSNLLVLLF